MMMSTKNSRSLVAISRQSLKLLIVSWLEHLFKHWVECCVLVLSFFLPKSTQHIICKHVCTERTIFVGIPRYLVLCPLHMKICGSFICQLFKYLGALNIHILLFTALWCMMYVMFLFNMISLNFWKITWSHGRELYFIWVASNKW